MKFTRRRYITNNSFQWRFVLGFVVASVMGNGLSTAIFLAFSIKKLEELRWSMHVTAKTTGEIMLPLLFRFTITNFIIILVVLIILSVWMMKKMNGPLYRISRDLEKVSEGDFSTSITVRGKDEFKNVAEALNGMVGKLKERLKKFKDSYEGVSRALVDLEVSYARGTDHEERTEELIRFVAKLRREGPLTH